MTTELAKETTLAQLTENIEYYSKLQAEIDRLQVSKEIARKVIMDAFSFTGMRTYTTPGNIRAWVDTRARQSISVKEAKELLDEDTFGKLCKESVSVVLTVRQLKQKEGKWM